jgi:CheY-like chemotaxis protein
MDTIDVLIISSDNGLISQILPHLDAWKKRYAVFPSNLSAISHLSQMQASSDKPPSCLLIVDDQDLDLDPSQLLSIKNNTEYSDLKLLYLYSPESDKAALGSLAQRYDDIISPQEIVSKLYRHLQVETLSTETDKLTHFAGCRNNSQPKRTPKIILLAEQDPGDRKELQNSLRNAGHKVISVGDGDQASEALEHQNFDLAIINLELPVMNGTQVIRLHRFTTPYIKQVPFIVITSNNTINSLRICRDLHVSACLFKPAFRTEILDRIDAFFNPDNNHDTNRSSHQAPYE